MPGPRPVRCNFPEDFVQEAVDTIRRRTVAIQFVQRFRLVLVLHEQPDLTNEAAAETVGLCTRGRRFFRRGSPGPWAKAGFFPRWTRL
jgi:hypothetical protein